MDRKGTLHIILVTRDIDDLCLPVSAAELPGGIHPIDHGHIDIQKKNVIFLFIAEKLRPI